MSVQDNIGLARRLTETWNARDPGAYGALLSDNHTFESDTIPAPAVGRAAAQDLLRVYWEGSSDLHFDITGIFGDGDKVAVQWQSSGRHTGPFAGIPATGRHSSSRGCTVYTCADGKITHSAVYWDSAHLLRDLGALPALT